MKSFVVTVSWLAAALLLGAGCRHDAAPLPASMLPIRAANYRPEPQPVLSLAEIHARTAARLAYAEELLRHKSARQLPAHLRRRRYHALQLLHAYRQSAQFSTMPDLDGRFCLLDGEGRPDALGYLMQQTGGEALVARLSQQHPYAAISSLNDAELKHWIKMSGLTLDECALIQGQ